MHEMEINYYYYMLNDCVQLCIPILADELRSNSSSHLTKNMNKRNLLNVPIFCFHFLEGEGRSDFLFLQINQWLKKVTLHCN